MRAFSAVVLGAFLGSCAPPPSLLDQIRSSGELRIITENSPTTFYYGAEERFGIEYELASAFADRLGVRLSLRTADEFWQLFPAVGTERAHIAAAGIIVTDPRRDIVDFGPGYQNVSAQLIYRMGQTRPRNLADVVGGQIEVEAATSHVGMLNQAARDVPELSWTENRNANAESLMRRVAAGDIDYAVVNSNEYKLLRHYYPEVRVAFTLDTGAELAWALPKGADDLREAVSAFFAEIEATGELQRILDRYYYAARDFDFVGSRAFVRHLNERLPQ
ncbi:MAG: transporter substrate-binding domain-containing protein, partial [Gammaproteobacteria bacterium]|nr:transporter substrate-binding domain-containing protein [Gammaproteobacteria bacterium]